jgi:hypothetical protein
MYGYTSNNWSHRNSNKGVKLKFGNRYRQTFNTFTAKDNHRTTSMSHTIREVLTYSMEQCPSWEANKSLQLVKKIPTFLWKPKVLYRTHKCPPPLPILSRLYPVPTTHSNSLKIHLNIIFPSTSESPQWPLSLWLPHQHPVHTALLSRTHHMPRSSHSSRF